jgi:hypothetical protein
VKHLDEYPDLASARTAALAAAGDGGLRVALAMLAESLIQLEATAPAVSAEVWDAYAAVLAAVPGELQPPHEATVLPLPSTTSRRPSLGR